MLNQSHLFTVSTRTFLMSCTLVVIGVTQAGHCFAQVAQPALIQGSPAAQHMEAERRKVAADQRQQRMLEDADKLLQMAQQLKVSVDKTNKNTLSVEVVREAERIEKLARQVKDGMRQ